MITFAYAALILVSVLISTSNWRVGVLWMLFAGALQDPVRKMMPGTPGYMVLAFIPVWFAICAALFLPGTGPWERFIRSYPSLRGNITFFVASLFLALLVLLANHGLGVWKVGAIGLMGYIFPLIAIVVGFHFVRSSPDLLRFIRVYSSLTAVLLIGGLLEHWKVFPEWNALGTEALGTTWIRHVPGYIVSLTSGFYRSPDLLGWHAGLLVMFSLLMTGYSRNPLVRLVWLVLVIWGSTILLISGRNKMIYMPLIFVAVVGVGYLYKGNVSRSVTIVLTSLLSLGLFFMVNKQLELDKEYIMYTQEGSETASKRLTDSGIGAVWITYEQSGFFGEGIGSASTGARYGGASGIKTWQESGPSKLMVELGAIGLAASLFLVAGIFLALMRGMKIVPRDSPDLILLVGFFGILAANGASFIVSHQAFGDPFLVTLAGFFIGITLSAPRWASGPTVAR